MSFTWQRIAQDERLQRSSHNASVVGSSVFVFGGELQPRQPRDNDVYSVDVRNAPSVDSHSDRTAVGTLQTSGDAPSPRVGSASVTLNGNVYFFSGRGGEAMAPIEENGCLWKLDVTAGKWISVSPSNTAGDFPQARSYHCMATDGRNTIYVHAGCPEKGRLSDLWAFNVETSQWKQLASAPDPPRGGPSIAYVEGKLYRMNGFDGKTEQGGAVDVYDSQSDSWSSIKFDADGKTGPGARSVAALLAVSIGGQSSLVTLFGESDPSSLGHQGAGKMLSDTWAYSIANSKWSQIANDSGDAPCGRGWFDADVLKIEDGKEAIVVAGGLGESNERLDDVWVLSLK